MNPQAATTASMRGLAAPRDHSAHRRAYLDTYARRRAGQTVIPIEAVMLPVEQPEDFMQVQPSSESFRYQPQPVQTSRHLRTSYLDTLQKRHQHAVGGAAQAEETILQSQLNSETEGLLEDFVTGKEQKLEANLRALYAGSLTEQIAKNSESASASHVRTIVMSTLACGIMAVGIFTFSSKYNPEPVVALPIGAPVIEVESSNVKPQQAPTPVTISSASGIGVHVDAPIRLTISSIGVNSTIEALGITTDGLIEVPKAYGVAGWYNKSSIPGKSGPAVLVGHYTGGGGGVFDNLGNLKDGDLITATNSKGQSFTYKVIARNEYERDKVPMADIFKASKESRLEIITCAGKWQANNYNKRLVVTAELVK